MSWRHVRLVTLAVAVAGALACRGSEDGQALTTDTFGGDISTDSATTGVVFHGVRHPLTSENYRRWLVAQAALDSLSEPSAMPRVDLRDPTDEDIEATVEFLEDEEAARRAIERSGLSVNEFVLTSVALGQALSLAGREVVPQENRALVESNRVELERVRSARRFHVVDDDEDEVDDDEDDGDDDDDERRGKKRGHHKHKHKHKHKH